MSRDESRDKSCLVEFFNSDLFKDFTDALVREDLQNRLDAKRDDIGKDKPVIDEDDVFRIVLPLNDNYSADREVDKVGLDNRETTKGVSSETTAQTATETTQETTQETPQETLSEVETRILSIIKSNSSVTRRSLAEIVGMSPDGVKYHLTVLNRENRSSSRRSNQEGAGIVPFNLLDDSATSIDLGTSTPDSHYLFANKYEFITYLKPYIDECLAKVSQKMSEQRRVWDAFALMFFDTICPKDEKTCLSIPIPC